MNFLKKFGTIVLKVAGVASGLIPLVSQALPSGAGATAVDKLDSAATAIITAEQMFTASGANVTGADKLKAVTPFVAALVKNITHLSGKQPKDEAKFEAAVTQIASGLADALSSYE